MVGKGVGRTSWESVSQMAWNSLTHIVGGFFFFFWSDSICAPGGTRLEGEQVK